MFWRPTAATTRPRAGRREQGAVQILVVGIIATLLGFAAFAIDGGYMLATRTQLQNAADSAALAAIGEVRSGALHSDGAAAAAAVAAAHVAGDAAVALDASDVAFGSYDFASRSFTSGGLAGVSAARVTARRTAGSPGGPLGLFLGQIVGVATAGVSASAVAALGSRDVVLVQDVTYSFREEIGDARDALETFALAMGDQSVAGDRLGLAIFNEAAETREPLVGIPDQLSDVISEIRSFPSCTNTAGNCGGTDIAPGILEGTEIIEAGGGSFAERVMVLVSDGVPCVPNNPSATQARKQAAEAAAQAAGDAGISIFTVFLDSPGPGNSYCSGVGANVANPNFMRQLVTGFGQFYATPDAEDLDEILVSILGQMPIRLVE